MYKDKIAYHSAKVAEYTQKQAEYEASISAPSAEVEALRNTLKSQRDGVGKVIADQEHPYPLYIPQEVEANQFYSTKENDGIKDVIKTYVAVKDGVVTAENFDEYMEAWDD